MSDVVDLKIGNSPSNRDLDRRTLSECKRSGCYSEEKCREIHYETYRGVKRDGTTVWFILRLSCIYFEIS